MKAQCFSSLVMAALIVSVQIGMAAQIEVPVKQVKGPNNSFSDSAYGVSLTYPPGWDLVHGFRWGPSNEQTTFVVRRTRRPALGTSIFYQKFTSDSPRPADVNLWFRDSFQKKEAAKKKDLRAYQNLPASFVSGTTTTGLPKCSYVAMFTANSRTMVEYYVRVAGREAYVMLITQGSPEELDAIRAEIDQMADTVQVP